jgi:hypothetical protein
MGVGVTTLVTIMVVMHQASFSIHSRDSANADWHLTQMAAGSAQRYYAADSEAEQWYAGLCGFLNSQDTTVTDWEPHLIDAGYKVSRTEAGILCVTEQFDMDADQQLTVSRRQLAVTVVVDIQGKPTIIQWQSGSVQTNDQG